MANKIVKVVTVPCGHRCVQDPKHPEFCPECEALEKKEEENEKKPRKFGPYER